MKTRRAKFDGRVKIEPEIQGAEHYRIGKNTYTVGTLEHFNNSEIEYCWANTSLFQDKKGKICSKHSKVQPKVGYRLGVKVYKRSILK